MNPSPSGTWLWGAMLPILHCCIEAQEVMPMPLKVKVLLSCRQEPFKRVKKLGNYPNSHQIADQLLQPLGSKATPSAAEGATRDPCIISSAKSSVPMVSL